MLKFIGGLIAKKQASRYLISLITIKGLGDIGITYSCERIFIALARLNALGYQVQDVIDSPKNSTYDEFLFALRRVVNTCEKIDPDIAWAMQFWLHNTRTIRYKSIRPLVQAMWLIVSQHCPAKFYMYDCPVRERVAAEDLSVYRPKFLAQDITDQK